MAEYTLHEAMTKLKTIEKKLEELMVSGHFCAVKIGEGERSSLRTLAGGISVEDEKGLRTYLQSRFDKVESLLGLREKIKRALVLRNTEVKVSVGGYNLTLAEAISMKHLLVDRKRFSAILSSDIRNSSEFITKSNEDQKKKIDKIVTEFYKAKSTDEVNTQDYESMTNSHWKMNRASLIDPVNLQKAVEKQVDLYDSFLEDFDNAITVANISNSIIVDD